MPVFEILGLLVLCGGVWLWMDSLATREVAVVAGRKACAAEGLQFLDETVTIQSLRLARNDEGRLVPRRVYGFEYSDTGDNRRRGHVTLVGREIVMLYTGPRRASAVLAGLEDGEPQE